MSINVRRLVPAVFMSLLLVGGAAMPTLAAAPETNVTVGSIASVAARAKPSVVGILNNMKASRSTDMGHAAGTGFVYRDGIIITNAHVVQNAAELKILFADETVETVLPSAVFADERSDIAVIKVVKKGLVPQVFGNSDNVSVGEQVIAVGNPLGFKLGNSVSAGILSGAGRALGSGYPFLQVDAPINPGNSGGPLFNLKGEVIGVNSAKMADIGVEGLGFAIPSNTARQIADTLLKDGKVERATLGVNFSEGWEAYFGVPDAAGVTISNIISDGPAGLTALSPGDKLVKLDDLEIHTSDNVASFLATKKPGQTVNVTVKRSGQTLTAMVKLASQDELKQLAEGQQAVEEGGILTDLTAGQIQEASDFGRSLSRGARPNRDYVASSGSHYAVLYSEFLYVARRIGSAYEFGFTPGVGLQQQAAKEIRNQLEVVIEVNGDKAKFLDGATFWLEQEGGVTSQGSGAQSVTYTSSPDGSVVIGNLAARFSTVGLKRNGNITVTVKLADGKTIPFKFTLKDLR
jgi:S1-C subfamily serine protease